MAPRRRSSSTLPLLLPSLCLLLLLPLLILTAVNADDVAAPAPPTYDPTKVDWASVVDACAAYYRFERRLGSFALRSAFHDAGSVTPQCATNPTPGCGGADGSLMVSATEQLHPNNRGELFAANTARCVLPIAKQYGASVADTLYVCALVAPSVLSYPAAAAPSGPPARAVRLDPVLRSAVAAGFKVGRIDRVNPDGNDPGLLPAASLDLNDFDEYFTSRGIEIDHAVALLGVHTLLRPKGCYVDGRMDARTGAVRGCDPMRRPPPGRPAPGDNGPFAFQSGSCPMVSMLQWGNSWFDQLLGLNGEGAPEITDIPSATQQLRPGQPGFGLQVSSAVCGFRSDAFRADAIARQQSGAFLTPPTDRAPTVINWLCPGSRGCRANPRTWFFTENDAHLANACRAGALLPAKPQASGAAAAQAQDASALLAEVAAVPAAAALMRNATLNADTPDDVALVKEVRDAFVEYSGRAGLAQWNEDFGAAYVAMSSMGAEWAPNAFVPTLMECLGGWRHTTVDSEQNRRNCNQRCGAGPADCPTACVCSSAPRSARIGIRPATGPVTSA